LRKGRRDLPVFSMRLKMRAKRTKPRTMAVSPKPCGHCSGVAMS